MIDTLTIAADTVGTPWYVEHYVELIFIALAAIKAVVNLVPSESPAPQIFGYIDTILTTIFSDRRKSNDNG